MIKIIVLSGLFSLPALAESFKIAGQLMEFQVKDGLLVKGCEKPCEALNKVHSMKSIPLSKLRKGKKFLNSTGSDACSLAYKGSSVLGVMANGDQRAFCVFRDESMIEMNSLTQLLESKKIVK